MTSSADSQDGANQSNDQRGIFTEDYGQGDSLQQQADTMDVDEKKEELSHAQMEFNSLFASEDASMVTEDRSTQICNDFEISLIPIVAKQLSTITLAKQHDFLYCGQGVRLVKLLGKVVDKDDSSPTLLSIRVQDVSGHVSVVHNILSDQKMSAFLRQTRYLHFTKLFSGSDLLHVATFVQCRRLHLCDWQSERQSRRHCGAANAYAQSGESESGG